MAFFRTKGIVLRKQNFGEYDEILSVLSPEHGKMSVFARGIRKMKSSLAGSLELFCESSLFLASGRNFDVCSQAAVIDSHSSLRESLSALSCGMYFLELSSRIFPAMEKDPRGYRLLSRTLTRLETETFPDILMAVALFAFLAHSGFSPAVTNCAGCGRAVLPSCFGAESGGALCGDCRSGNLQFLTREAAEVFSFLPGCTLEEMKRICKAGPVYRKIRECLETYMRAHCGFYLSSSAFVNRILSCRETA